MFGFGYAMVPMYRAICSALGINVLSLSSAKSLAAPRGAADGNGQVDTSRSITVEFDANAAALGLQAGGPPCRRPSGRTGHGDVRVQERANRPMVAQAIPNYTPHQAMHALQQAGLLLLQQCAAAWREQAVAGGVRHRPQAAADDVKTITLSYTFFGVPGKSAAKRRRSSLRGPQGHGDRTCARPFSARCLPGRPSRRWPGRSSVSAEGPITPVTCKAQPRACRDRRPHWRGFVCRDAGAAGAVGHRQWRGGCLRQLTRIENR